MKSQPDMEHGLGKGGNGYLSQATGDSPWHADAIDAD